MVKVTLKNGFGSHSQFEGAGNTRQSQIYEAGDSFEVTEDVFEAFRFKFEVAFDEVPSDDEVSGEADDLPSGDDGETSEAGEVASETDDPPSGETGEASPVNDEEVGETDDPPSDDDDETSDDFDASEVIKMKISDIKALTLMPEQWLEVYDKELEKDNPRETLVSYIEGLE